jgi:hypothetical protein
MTAKVIDITSSKSYSKISTLEEFLKVQNEYLRKDNKLQADAYKFHYKIVRLYKEILGSNF